MYKYSFEFKKKVVLAYLNGEGSFRTIANKYEVPSWGNVKKWVRSYEKFGDDGIKRSRKRTFYTFEQKMAIVELYLSSEISYQDLALQIGVNNPSQISNWVNDYREFGPEALNPKKGGLKRTMNKSDSDSSTKECKINTDDQHIKDLENELYKLRLENAFLKELRRLRLEDEGKMREWHSSSTVSEENSN